MRIIAIHVGRPRSIEAPGGRVVRTAFGKQPSLGPVRATPEGLEGDAQADRRFHGGPDQVALAYSADHYPRWREELDWPALGAGALGENLTVEGADETSVCIGDVWRCSGGALLQVSSPRTPCVKISVFHRRGDLGARLAATGLSGWYLRVLEEGEIDRGDVELAARPNPSWTVLRAMRLLAHAGAPERAELAALPELNPRWKATLARRR